MFILLINKVTRKSTIFTFNFYNNNNDKSIKFKE